MRTAWAVLLLISPATLLADQVVLRGGRRVSGVVVERSQARVVLEVGPGRVTFPASEVERVETGSSGLGEYRRRAAALQATDVQGWLALARWAADNGMATQSREALEQVLSVDPGNPLAHSGLGNVRWGERWISRDDAYRERGFVEFEGAWVRPREREALLRQRADEAAAARARVEAEARVREAEARAQEAEAAARRAEARERSEGISTEVLWLGGGACRGCTRPRPVPPPPAAPAPEPTPAPLRGGWR
jgi:hypothetical protein